MLNIWNNIDISALYFGLDRLEGEDNSSFLERLKQISKYKYKTNYYNLVHSITAQMGYKTNVIGRIKNNRGNIFDCSIEWDYFRLNEILGNGSLGECIRVFIGEEDCVLQKVADVISSSERFELDIDQDKLSTKMDFIIRNRSIISASAFINNQYTTLPNKHIVPNSQILNSQYFFIRKDNMLEITNSGDYFIDWGTGFIYCFDGQVPLTSIHYRYFNESFAIEETEINLIPVKRYFQNGYSDKTLEQVINLLNGTVAGI